MTCFGEVLDQSVAFVSISIWNDTNEYLNIFVSRKRYKYDINEYSSKNDTNIFENLCTGARVRAKCTQVSGQVSAIG